MSAGIANLRYITQGINMSTHKVSPKVVKVKVTPEQRNGVVKARIDLVFDHLDALGIGPAGLVTKSDAFSIALKSSRTLKEAGQKPAQEDAAPLADPKPAQEDAALMEAVAPTAAPEPAQEDAALMKAAAPMVDPEPAQEDAALMKAAAPMADPEPAQEDAAPMEAVAPDATGAQREDKAATLDAAGSEDPDGEPAQGTKRVSTRQRVPTSAPKRRR